MALSTDIPNAMLNIKIVDGLMEMAKKPIIPAVINWGIKFGINDITIILPEVNKRAIKAEMMMSANNKLVIRFFTR